MDIVTEEVNNNNFAEQSERKSEKDKNHLIAFSTETRQFPQETQMLDKINALFTYMDSTKSDLLNINESYFKNNFNKIFVSESNNNNQDSPNNYNNIHEYFALNQETLIPEASDLKKELIVEEHKFWIIWIEFLTLTFKIREKQDFSDRKSNYNSEDLKSKNENFFKKFEIIFNLFNASFIQAQRSNLLHEYYMNFLKALPLDNIFLIDKKFRKTSEEIENGKLFYLNKKSNQIINQQHEEKEYNNNESHSQKEKEAEKIQKEINNQALKVKENKKKINFNKEYQKSKKVVSERKSENPRLVFTNICRNLMLDSKANTESEILKEKEFYLAKEVNELNLPNLGEFNLIEKDNLRKLIRRRKVNFSILILRFIFLILKI